jgi:hypothetical protein
MLDQLFHQKNLIIMHNNGARNLMIEDGIKHGGRWILPFDGNCFFTVGAWKSVKEAIESHGKRTKYFYTMMQRMQSNEALFDPNFVPNAIEEPQV